VHNSSIAHTSPNRSPKDSRSKMSQEKGHQNVMPRWPWASQCKDIRRQISRLGDVGYVDMSGNWRRVLNILDDVSCRRLSSPAVQRVASENGTCETPGLYRPTLELNGTRKSVPDHPSPSLQSYLGDCTQQSHPLHENTKSTPRTGRGGRLQCDGCRRQKKGRKVKLMSHFF
jgi:hypothetical protein